MSELAQLAHYKHRHMNSLIFVYGILQSFMALVWQFPNFFSSRTIWIKRCSVENVKKVCFCVVFWNKEQYC